MLASDTLFAVLKPNESMPQLVPVLLLNGARVWTTKSILPATPSDIVT
jgi:hypothetical protein